MPSDGNKTDHDDDMTGQAQDRTTISYTIDEGTRAKTFDVMFALGEPPVWQHPLGRTPGCMQFDLFCNSLTVISAISYIRCGVTLQVPLHLPSATPSCLKCR